MAIPAKSPSELNFQAQVDAQRKRHSLAVKVGACGFLLVGASLMLPQKWLVWIGVPGAVLVAVSLLLFFTAPLLNCPDCGESAEDFGPFCPVCGSEGCAGSWRRRNATDAIAPWTITRPATISFTSARTAAG
jgi:hypothetical protein